jgi:peptide/nickel transport system substrate-binding protein
VSRAAWSRRQFLGSSALAAGAVLAGCRRAAPAARRGARPVRYPIGTDPNTLDFTRTSEKTALALGHLVSDSLVAYDAQLRLVSSVARSWAWSEDHLRLTFRIRDGVSWHDGAPVGAADVVHTWRALTDPRTGLPDRAVAFNLVEAVEAPDPSTVLVTYRRPHAPALAAWTVPLVPQHVPASSDAPIGCGPWRLQRWERGQRLVLEPVAPAAGLVPLRFEILPDLSTRFAALCSGGVDICPLTPEHAGQLEGDADLQRRFRVLRYHALFFQYIAWRMDGSNPFFGDRRVRLAMTLAIDRGSYVRDVVRGFGAVASSTFHPDLWPEDAQLAPWPYDPARARELLRSAGWVPGRDGALERAGVPFRFHLSFPGGIAENRRIAEFVAASLARIGAVADLEPLDWAVFQERTRQRKFAAMLAYRYTDPDPDPYDLWHSSQAAGGVNYAGFTDREVDGWIESARESFDTAGRTRLYRSIERRLHDEQPDTVLCFPEARVAIDRNLSGVVPSPMGLLECRPGPLDWRWAAGAAEAPS